MGRTTRRLFGLLLLGLTAVALIVMRADDDVVRASVPEPALGLPEVRLTRGSEFLRGVALGLYYREVFRDYEEPLEAIADLGADTVSLVVTWSQETIHSITVERDPEESRVDAIVERALEQARDEGLRVLMFPIVKVRTRGPGDWRGVLAPSDVDAWFSSYTDYLVHYARMAEESGVAIFSVGSELGTLERYEAHWRRTLGRVRQVFSGQVLYSANWDHYRETPFWDAVDLIGMTGYHELAESEETRVDEASLLKAWSPIRNDLVAFAHEQGRSFIFTEVGYYSQAGTAWHPWDYTRAGPVDLEEQLLCYRAFYEAWRDIPELGGVFFWHFWGDGGAEDGSYNPRGKPAEDVIRFWFRQASGFAWEGER